MTTRRAWAALAVLSVAAFTFVTTELLPIGLLTVIASDLGRSRSQVGLLVTGYAVAVALAPVLGVPLCTWLGQQAGWCTAFAVVGGRTCAAASCRFPSPGGSAVATLRRGAEEYPSRTVAFPELRVARHWPYD